MTWKGDPNSSWFEHVYEVRLTDDESLGHRGDIGFANAIGRQPGFEQMELQARHYWNSDETGEPVWEFVSESPVEIGARIRIAHTG